MQDIMKIAKVANQLFSNMQGEKMWQKAEINISDIEFNEDNKTDSITVSVNLYNINEPRKDMIPKNKYQGDGNTETGFEYSNFTKPRHWSHTEY